MPGTNTWEVWKQKAQTKDPDNYERTIIYQTQNPKRINKKSHVIYTTKTRKKKKKCEIVGYKSTEKETSGEQEETPLRHHHLLSNTLNPRRARKDWVWTSSD